MTPSERAMAERHLAQTERHVRSGREQIERQTQIVAELERDGHDTTEAKALLATFHDIQGEHVAHRDRLLAELSAPE